MARAFFLVFVMALGEREPCWHGMVVGGKGRSDEVFFSTFTRATSPAPSASNHTKFFRGNATNVVQRLRQAIFFA